MSGRELYETYRTTRLMMCAQKTFMPEWGGLPSEERAVWVYLAEGYTSPLARFFSPQRSQSVTEDVAEN